MPWRKSTAKHHLAVSTSFKESHISHKKWVPSSQEYILEGPTNLKNHPLIVTTKLKKVYK